MTRERALGLTDLLAECPNSLVVEFAKELSIALRLLGADSFLQSAVNSMWEGDFNISIEFLRQWNNDERDRIAAVMRSYSKWQVWAPDTQFSRTAHQGCSRQVSLTVKTTDQLIES